MDAPNLDLNFHYAALLKGPINQPGMVKLVNFEIFKRVTMTLTKIPSPQRFIGKRSRMRDSSPQFFTAVQLMGTRCQKISLMVSLIMLILPHNHVKMILGDVKIMDFMVQII